PMLLLSRHSRDEHGTPVEWVRSVYRGSRYRFTATLTPPETGGGGRRGALRVPWGGPAGSAGARAQGRRAPLHADDVAGAADALVVVEDEEVVLPDGGQVPGVRGPAEEVDLLLGGPVAVVEDHDDLRFGAGDGLPGDLGPALVEAVEDVAGSRDA